MGEFNKPLILGVAQLGVFVWQLLLKIGVINICDTSKTINHSQLDNSKYDVRAAGCGFSHNTYLLFIPLENLFYVSINIIFIYTAVTEHKYFDANAVLCSRCCCFCCYFIADRRYLIHPIPNDLRFPLF